jgi:hypothetical protein
MLAAVSRAPSEGKVPAGLTPAGEALLGHLPEVRIRDGRIRIETIKAIDFLRGDWLEALCLCAVRAALAGRPAVQALGKLPVTRIGVGAEETEFDPVVYGRDRLSLVGCKAITAIDARCEGINRRDRYRMELSGRPGRAWLVAPRLTEARLRGTGCLDQAQAVESAASASRSGPGPVSTARNQTARPRHPGPDRPLDAGLRRGPTRDLARSRAC